VNDHGPLRKALQTYLHDPVFNFRNDAEWMTWIRLSELASNPPTHFRICCIQVSAWIKQPAFRRNFLSLEFEKTRVGE